MLSIRNWSCLLLNKTQLRNELRQQRRVISSEKRHQAAESAAELFSKQLFFQQAQTIATYLGTTEEFDSIPIIQKIWQTNKKCYLPVLKEPDKCLNFKLFNENDKLWPNQYNILEPGNTESIAAEKLDVVLMPLVGFDQQGHRLGMGGGYYDRTFAFLEGKTQQKPMLIGLAYAEQQVRILPHEYWDVPLDGVLTEKEFMLFPLN